jgi:hypothetical protein
MNGSIFDRLRRVQRARISRVLRPLVGAAIMSAVATGASAEWQSGPFAMVCALKETKVITLIEDHGGAGDLPSDSLGEALALYDSILNLGPVASFRKP